jgi:hypothetical protein
MRTHRFLLLVSLFSIAITASADTIVPWTDSTTHWPGWGGQPSYGSSTVNEDSQDTIANPQISDGFITISDTGFLKSITYNFSSPPGWTSSQMKPGDLFLDINNDGSWDFVLSLYNGQSNSDNYNKYIPTISGTDAPFYHITSGAEYLITGNDGTGYWFLNDIRNNHPFALTGLTDLAGMGSISSDINSISISPFTYTVPDNTIFVVGSFTFGFATNCANDDVYESMPLPEPGSVFLLGTGLIGLVFIRKKILRNHNETKPETAIHRTME